MPRQIFEIVRAPEARPIGAREIEAFFRGARPESEWVARDVTSEIECYLPAGRGVCDMMRTLYETPGVDAVSKVIAREAGGEAATVTVSVTRPHEDVIECIRRLKRERDAAIAECNRRGRLLGLRKYRGVDVLTGEEGTHAT